MNTEQFDNFVQSDSSTAQAVVSATAVPVLNTETVTEATPAKRHYTRKEDMQNGNNAILATLSFDAATALGKQDILAKLSEENKALVLKNWNMRLEFLQETGELGSTGKKVGKKYFRLAVPATTND